MIVSASRRTDIPAFYPEWFVNRLRAGWCLVPHPFRKGLSARVSLDPEEAEVVVFWTRNPAPLLRHLPELDRLGCRYYFQYTLLDYPETLEPLTIPLARKIETFRKLARRIGPERVIWRYDPVVLSEATPAAFHLERFGRIADALSGSTRRAVVSLLDVYRKIVPRLREAGVRLLEYTPEEVGALAGGLAGIAAANGLKIQSCAEEADLRPWGILPGKCVDDGLIRKVFGIEVSGRKDPGQRKLCRCVPSRDIGVYDTCPAGCVYCYAVRDRDSARRNFSLHDPASPALGRDKPFPRISTAVIIPRIAVRPMSRRNVCGNDRQTG